MGIFENINIKEISNSLFNYLLFKDIAIKGHSRLHKKVYLAKVICITIMILTLLAGCLFTVNHALNYYEDIKGVFLSNPEEYEDVIIGSQKAVYFTREKGDPHLIQGVLAYYEDYERDKLNLLIADVNDIPVRLISIQNRNERYVYPFEDNQWIQSSDPIEYYLYEFDNVNEDFIENISEISVNYAYDDQIVRQVPISPFKRINEEIFHRTVIRTKDNMSDFNFLVEEENYIYFIGNEITISKPLFIPPGKELLIFPGQTIDLINQAYIVARTPIQLEGTKSNPIRVFTSDGSGRGIFVSQANGDSNISYTVFDGLNAPMSGFWSLTGAITFYESDVNIAHSDFVNNGCEDGLNIIRSDFKIWNSYFGNTSFDAFDADFCTGTITDCVFENTINDAIDVSTTQLEISSTNMINIGDKGISGGEKSQVLIRGLNINNAVIGLASKDLSVISGSNISISNSKIAITLYEKKPEFGPATIDIHNYTTSGHIDLDYLIQKKSTLIIDNQVMVPRAARKEQYLFEKMISGEPIQ